MTTSTKETKAKFTTLSSQEQKRINRLAAEVKQFGANVFFIETGSRIDQADHWQVVRFVMEAN